MQLDSYLEWGPLLWMIKDKVFVFITCMDIAVMFEVTFLLETFSTNITFVRLLRRVDLTMSPKSVVMAELLATNVAVVSSLVPLAIVACVGTET